MACMAEEIRHETVHIRAFSTVCDGVYIKVLPILA